MVWFVISQGVQLDISIMSTTILFRSTRGMQQQGKRESHEQMDFDMAWYDISHGMGPREYRGIESQK